MLEAEIAARTEVGVRILELYENGQLVPDEIVVQLIEQKLKNSKGVKGYIFKGFPRTLVQSYILDGLLKKHGSKIAKVIEFDVPMLELINRLDARSKTDKCMPYDSNTSKIVKRLQEHETKTIPVIEKYEQSHNFKKINGMGTFEEVFERSVGEIEKGIKHMR
jgi:adenylate kinase